MSSPYGFLLDTYQTEILKTASIWRAFPETALDFRPAAKSRTVRQQMEHQLQSEAAWMGKMFGIETGAVLPATSSVAAFIEKYTTDAQTRLGTLRGKTDPWWNESVMFFDVPRSRAWVMLRRMAHSAHHRGQLIVYLRVLERRVPSVYGPTADTGDKVLYSFAEEQG